MCRGVRRWPTPWRLCGPLFPGLPRGCSALASSSCSRSSRPVCCSAWVPGPCSGSASTTCSRRRGPPLSLQQVGFGRRPSFVFGYVLFWGVLLAGVAAALSILGLASLQRNMDLMVALAGKAVVAVLILAAGLAAAGWLSNLASAQAEGAGLRGGDLFGRAVFAFVLAVAVLVAAAQVGIEISVLVLLAAIIFGTAGIVAALALGLGLVPLSGNIAAGRYVEGNGIRQGDEISVNGIRGTVEELGLASVTLRSDDGNIHHVPNRVLLEEVVSKIPPDDE